MNEPGLHRLTIADLFLPPCILLKMTSTERDDALLELVSHIPALRNNAAGQQTLLHALREREQLHSTGIGDGIALPHARNALVGLVDHPVIVFGRSPTGIPFGAIDGEPAKLLFLLVAPNVTAHLQMLARLSRILRDRRTRRILLEADRPEKVITAIRAAEAAL